MTLTETLSEIDNEQLKPNELTFEKDRPEYRNPIDIFAEYKDQIFEIENLKLENKEYEGIKKTAIITKEIFDNYIEPQLSSDRIFINFLIKNKECMRPIISHVIEKILAKKIVNNQEEILPDIATIMGEILINFPSHRSADSLEEIPFRMLLDNKKIQFLVGDLNLPKISQNQKAQLCEAPDFLEEHGRGLFLMNSFCDNLELAGSPIIDIKGNQKYNEQNKPLYKNMTFLATKNLS